MRKVLSLLPAAVEKRAALHPQHWFLNRAPLQDSYIFLLQGKQSIHNSNHRGVFSMEIHAASKGFLNKGIL